CSGSGHPSRARATDATAAEWVARPWLEPRATAIELAAVPRVVPVPATTRAAEPPSIEPSPDGSPAPKVLMSIRDDPDRPTGPRFGTLVHAVLATIALDADAASIRAGCALQSRILGATVAECEAAERLTAAVLGS